MNKTPGQKHLQQMMAQSQKRMADQRQRSMQQAWMQKQMDEARQFQQAQEGEQSTGQAGSTWQGRGYFQADERFNQVEAEVERLKQQRQSGRISEEQFADQLKNLMIKDNSGNWWMIGTKTDAWYRFDGQNWVQSTPPGRWVHTNNAVQSSKSSTRNYLSYEGHPIRAIILFFFLIGLFAALGFLAGMLIAEVLGIQGVPPFIAAGVFWVFGFFFAINRARRTWRGY
jgi:hypothetical protein